MTEDIFILDCHSDIFVWVGQEVDSKTKIQALSIGEVRIFILSRANFCFAVTDYSLQIVLKLLVLCNYF